MHQPVHDIGKALRIRVLFQDIEDILKHRHFPVVSRVFRVRQAFVVVGDAFLVIGLYQRLIQKLPFLMCHVRDQQGKEDVEPLYLCCKLRFFRLRAVQNVTGGGIHLPDLHDVDAVFGGRGDLDELPADVAAGPVELMPF